ncbi:diguanylate cyclase domain-containing protein [Chitinimonas sp. BJYL2]|uniref:diguanylate cyclase domain-containing protein n=1 Tax=Chitinimonas sp. BJYL2 TaxID=2976696 RepID=UPI0022B520AF|nr:diguanylate cyclase [Chitinimonas sp. BJYL2]
MRSHRWFWPLLAALIGLLALAAEPKLAEYDEQRVIAEAWYDPGGRQTIHDVIREANFAPRTAVRIPLLRPPDSTLWLRFKLARPPTARDDWWLVLSDSGLREATLYQSLGGEGFRRSQTGTDMPFRERALPFRQGVLAIELGTEPSTFYLRLKSRDDFATDLQLRQPRRMALVEHGRGLIFGLIYGSIVVLALYNLFMLRSLRETLYLPYVVASVSALLTIVALNGHGHQYLWPDSAWLARHDTVLFAALWALAFIHYTRHLLELPQHLPWLDRLGLGLSVLTLLAMLLHFAEALMAGFWLSILCYGLIALYMLLVSVWRWHQGSRPAGYFLAGNLVLCGSVTLIILMVFGIIPANLHGLNLMQIGIALQSLLLSLALADRVRDLHAAHDAARKSALAAQQAQIDQLREHEEELENRVAARTEALAEANARLRDEIDARSVIENQLKESEARLRQQALHDALTGLPNRLLLSDRLHQVLSRQPRQTRPFALMLLDLDRFKPVNDQYGHEVGDHLLIEVATRLRQTVRVSDTAGRIGGDEFVLLAEELANRDAAGQLAAKLVEAISAPYEIDGTPIHIGVSIGIAFYPGDGEDGEMLLRHADAAMYTVKRSGRNAYAFWHDTAIGQPDQP